MKLGHAYPWTAKALTFRFQSPTTDGILKIWHLYKSKNKLAGKQLIKKNKQKKKVKPVEKLGSSRSKICQRSLNWNFSSIYLCQFQFHYCLWIGEDVQGELNPFVIGVSYNYPKSAKIMWSLHNGIPIKFYCS